MGGVFGQFCSIGGEEGGNGVGTFSSVVGPLPAASSSADVVVVDDKRRGVVVCPQHSSARKNVFVVIKKFGQIKKNFFGGRKYNLLFS